MYAVPLDITLSHFTQRYTVCMYAVPFNITLSHFSQRYTVCAYAVLFDITLSHFKQRYTVWYVHCAIRHCAKPFPNDSTLHRMFVHCTIRHYVEAFDATLQHLCTVLQMSAKLFAIELVHFTVSCSNST